MAEEVEFNAQRRIIAYLDGLPPIGDGSESALTSSPSGASGMPSVLDRAFKGEL